jgi:hypothetical protein
MVLSNEAPKYVGDARRDHDSLSVGAGYAEVSWDKERDQR